MSTRAGIIVKDAHSEIHFYRHSDGYPEGTLPTLNKFLDWVKQGKLRADAMQASGWLVIIGHTEYEVKDEPVDTNGWNWKVGAYEPTTNVNDHGDLEYLYTIDLETKKITYK